MSAAVEWGTEGGMQEWRGHKRGESRSGGEISRAMQRGRGDQRGECRSGGGIRGVKTVVEG